MSKRKLYDDDIYVAPYTRKTGKYRHVSGHYRRRSYRKKPSHSPSSYQHKPKGKFDFDTIFFCVVLAVMLFILIAVVQPAWLYVLFGLLIYLLIALALGCIVSWLWENKFKYDKDGFDRQGYNREGYDREGFNRLGYNSYGYNRRGYNKDGYDQAGYDCFGYDRQGYNKEGFDQKGYDREGYNLQGYDQDGYDRAGFCADGYSRDGFDREGWDRYGYNRKTVSIVLASIVSVMMPLDMIRQAMIEKDSTIMGKAGSKSGKES